MSHLVYPLAAPLGGDPPKVSVDADDLLAVLDGFFPASYLDPIKTVGPGYELYQAQAAIFVRVGLAVARLNADAFIATASSPALAVGTVQFSRLTASAGAVTVKAGTVVRASFNGASFFTIADAVFGASDLGPIDTPIRALGYGYEYNVAGQFVAPNGDVDPGTIDTIDLPIQDPPFGDETITVTNETDTGGGTPPALDIHGSERNLVRYPNETNPAYRTRIQHAPDTVSPAAMRRQLKRYIAPTGLAWELTETWTHSYQECYDAPEADADSPAEYSEIRFVYDDGQGEYASPITNRWLGIQDHVGAFTVSVERPSWIEEYGFAYDDPALTDDAQTSELGRRAVSAYDVPITLPDPALAGAYDGSDFGIDDFFGGLLDMLDRNKAFGVLASVFVVDPLG